MASKIIISAHESGTLRSEQVRVPDVPYYVEKCFFLRRELGRSKLNLKNSGEYQHVKPSVNRLNGYTEFLEYSYTKKYYKTLEDWVQSEGCTMNDVLYGRQDFDRENTHITLAELLRQLGYNTEKLVPAVDPEVDDLTRLFQKLRTNSVPINQIMVPKTVMVSGDVYLMDD
jgi:hypothetical protein